MTPREALDRITALCDSDGLDVAGEDGFLLTSTVRAVLAEVSPEPGGVLDHDQAREAAWGAFRDGPDYQPTDRSDARGPFDAGWDAALALVRPTAIDRDALGAAWDDGNAVGLDGWRGPGRGEDIDPEAVRARERYLDKTLVRPAPAGVTLAPGEDLDRVIAGLRMAAAIVPDPAPWDALAARLEAGVAS